MLASQFLCGLSWAEDELIFTTKSFDIRITEHCEEEVIGCDRVEYFGVNRKTGKSIRLRGKQLHSICADGVTPCHFQGYVFRNSDVTYSIILQGESWLAIRKGGRLLLHESGDWRRENSVSRSPDDRENKVGSSSQ
ncbi:MAG: hypothetical protein J0I77_20595 [Rudaea sp.]|uniref:hypothetical protein n=1 Tax=Rudaea sp. 3F27F6 TaxID=2502208 RepID=UPI0014858B89|nr:hypothetical protein [Rudaea sp. 3F27F6]MBN8888124.1 hypothetical protein [Rudaea sp.]MBR0345407.1 hypothetical protein [Rudaea sp.]